MIKEVEKDLSPEPLEGIKYDQDKIAMELIPPEGEYGVAKALTYGARKYGRRNIEKGMDWDRVYGAARRHLLAWYSGEDTDTESGLSHLYHACANVMFLIMFQERGIGKDNRPKRKN